MNIGKSFGEFGNWANSVLNRVGLHTNSFFNTTTQSTAPFNPASSGWDAAMNNMVGNISTQQQDVQAEAMKLIAAHTKLLTLDTKSLGETLAAGAVKQPALVRAVLQQLEAGNLVTGASNGQRVARVMTSRLTDEQMVTLAGTTQGRALLKTAQAALANDATVFTTDKLITGAADRKLTARIDSSIKRADELASAQKAIGTRRQNSADMFPPRYTADDVKLIFGQDAYTRLDDWVNTVARGEGSFTDAAILRDSGGLSVGLKQWTQNSGRLSELMQRYRDVALRENRLGEFHQAFGGRDNAERLLQTLRTNPQSIKSRDIQSLFAEAGRKTIFQRAQIEMAREEVAVYVREIARDHPYSQNGTVSAQSMATSLIVRNIGPNRRDNVYRATINDLYSELVSRNASVREQLNGRQTTDDVKREIVTANVSEQTFNECLAKVAPRILYTSPANYRSHATGLENRLRSAINLFPPDERVDPNRL